MLFKDAEVALEGKCASQYGKIGPA